MIFLSWCHFFLLCKFVIFFRNLHFCKGSASAVDAILLSHHDKPKKATQFAFKIFKYVQKVFS